MNTVISKSEFDRIKKSGIPKSMAFRIIADMCRINMLRMIKEAGSGHIGASFSIIDCLVLLYYGIMKHDPRKPKWKERDKLIISKGHAVPAQYAILASLGYYPTDELLRFRELGGLQGHPDISNIGIDGNTGSLGMGLSKAKGYLLADRINKAETRAFVILGDGELAEGQNWEAIQSASFMKLNNLVAIIDKNQFQTDSPVSNILDIGDIEKKFLVFGWDVIRLDGHDFSKMLPVISRYINKKGNKPKAIILDTIKGKGVSFMEAGEKYIVSEEPYIWHGKCPDDSEYRNAINELYEKINNCCNIRNIKPPAKIDDIKNTLGIKASSAKRVTEGFERKLLELGAEIPEIVVFDADLERESLLYKFHQRWPERFFQIGIAEQDMVSTAGGVALAGKIPVVSSYTAFLTARSEEQIFNNSSEKTHIIYLGHMAGLLPAKPGKSHIGIRDIANLKSIPNMVMIEPLNEYECGEAFEYLAREHKGPGYLRLKQFGVKTELPLPDSYKLGKGKGCILREGHGIACIVSCPFLTLNVLDAAELLEPEAISLRVIHIPWLNCFDIGFLKSALQGCSAVVNVESHMIQGGTGETIASLIAQHFQNMTHKIIGIKEFAQSGANEDILKYYGLDIAGIKNQILTLGKQIQ